MATLLIGYDVEATQSEVTESFLGKLNEIHCQLNVPCTLFLLGKTLKSNINCCQNLAGNKLFDFQQHTYSHALLKTVVMEKNTIVEVSPGASLSQLRNEVKKTVRLLKKYLGITPIGLRGPCGYYRGLSDRPDILAILHKAGIRFTSTYGRNEKDFQPVPFEVQPFWYNPQGFGDILEIPIQGWQDVYLRAKYGWNNLDAYAKHVRRDLDYILEHNLVWGYCQHDWSSIRNDADMAMTRQIIEYALRRGVRIICYREYYEEVESGKASN